MSRCPVCGGMLNPLRHNLAYRNHERFGEVIGGLFLSCIGCGAGYAPAEQFIDPFKGEVLRKEYSFQAGDLPLTILP